MTTIGLDDGCRDSPSGPVATVAIAPATARLPVGASQPLTATARDAQGNSLTGRAITWTTSDPSLATVSSSGVVTAVAAGGPVMISAKSEGQRGSAAITVVPIRITSPLRLSSINPRYFTDATGRAIYLTGAHTWEDFQDVALSDPPTAFDWTKYLGFLRQHNHNFTELWRWEQAKWIAGFDSAFVYSPVPYLRIGPDTALDGKSRFDLTKFDQKYFDRMRQRVADAGQHGIYVSIMLFDGWSIEKKGFPHGNPWLGHPFNRLNNINGIDGDPNRDDQGIETHTLQIPAVSELQDAYVRKVIDAVNDLDNVLYEVSNETTGGAPYVEWQNHIIALVKQYEARKAKQHPVGMTALFPNGKDIDLFASTADFVSPAGMTGVSDTPAASGSKVLLWDTDHLCGNCGDGPWVWRSFTRGVNPVFMDVYDGAFPVTQLPKPRDPRWEDARHNMGYTLTYALRMNLVAMTPHGELSSTGYCLANPTAQGGEYLVYLNGARSVKVNLAATPGTLTVEWFNPTTGRAMSGGTVPSGARQVFKAPSGAEVLYIHN
jgi:Family of unknown function (DUF6298)/Bacterial Ig-like domain (group 2)/Putative collagen-binding domain of a collagenase